ncbi:MAG: isoprenyl transferase [Candidatus Omnitrophota bacterium]|jgi:undecaprenyl diphosphate synthase
MRHINKIPGHIAIIMDGNGRWAKERRLPRTAGHREGVKRIKEVVKAAGDMGIKFITFFAFSTENWARSKNEIDMLLRLLDNFLEREVKELDKNNIRFLVIGRKEPVPAALQKKIAAAQEMTKNNSAMTVILALNYGSRQEIVDAAKDFARDVKSGRIRIEDLDEKVFSGYLYTAGIPDPDLLIRTSGEIRISNFLLWQLSYSELYFPGIYWPQFNRRELLKAIREFQARERRFGKADAV